MGYNATLAVVDRELTDDELAAIGFEATGDTVSFEEVTTGEAEFGSVLVARRGGYTLLASDVSPLAELADRPDGLTGTWWIGVVGSTGDVYVYAMHRDGATQRSIMLVQGDLTHRGTPVGDESAAVAADGTVPDGEQLLWLPLDASGCARVVPHAEVAQLEGHRYLSSRFADQ